MGLVISVGMEIEIFQPENDCCRAHFVRTTVKKINDDDSFETAHSVLIDGFSVNEFNLDEYFNSSWVYDSEGIDTVMFQNHFLKHYYD